MDAVTTDSTGPGQCRKASFCKYGVEPSGSIKADNFLTRGVIINILRKILHQIIG
jgi:hypothetical protein